MDDLRRRAQEFVDDFPSELAFSATMIDLAQRRHGKVFPENTIPIIHDILVRIRKGIVPTMPARGHTPFEIERERQQLNAFLRVRDREGHVAATLVTMSSFVSQILEQIPETRPSSITAGLASTIQNFPLFIDRLIEPFFYPDVIKAENFESLRRQLWANICIASGMPIDSKHTSRHIWPEHSKLPRSELFHTYLKYTPLLRLSRVRVPFFAPRGVLNSHTAIFAPSDHGKTQLLQCVIHDLIQDDPPGMFIMDSHGDMLRNLRPIVPADRLVVLDPAVDPPTIDLFARGTTDEDFLYLFSALDQEFTTKQTTTVLYMLRLMQQFERPTLVDFLNVLQERAKNTETSKYAAQYGRLDEAARSFFDNRFFSPKMIDNRNQVADRIYSLLANHHFKAMFAAKGKPLDLARLMAERKIVLINTSTNVLGRISPILGRYIISRCLSAALARLSLPERQRPLTLLVLDEAHTYFDDNTDRILSEARKCNLGLMFATQFVDQMPDQVKRSVATNTTTKLAGPVSVADARWLAAEMRTSPAMILNLKREDRKLAEFALYVRNVTPSAVKVQVPFGVVKTAQQTGDVPSEPVATRAMSDIVDDDSDVAEVDDEIDHRMASAFEKN